eukprot:gene16243-22412_t
MMMQMTRPTVSRTACSAVRPMPSIRLASRFVVRAAEEPKEAAAPSDPVDDIKANADGTIFADDVTASAAKMPKPKENLSPEMKEKLRNEYLGLGGSTNTKSNNNILNVVLFIAFLVALCATTGVIQCVTPEQFTSRVLFIASSFIHRRAPNTTPYIRGLNLSISAWSAQRRFLRGTMVAVKVLFFAQSRELVGTSEELVTLPADASTLDLHAHLLQQHPGLDVLMKCSVFALNQEYLGQGDRVALMDGDEVAIIPPLSGG